VSNTQVFTCADSAISESSDPPQELSDFTTVAVGETHIRGAAAWGREQHSTGR